MRWSRPEDFGSLETLLTHPLIFHFAFQPKNERQRVKVLRAALREVIDRIRRREGEDPPLGRSVAEAGTALLRLAPEFEQMSLEEIREHITSVWEKQGGGKLSANGFRLHLEVPEVYEPLAREFQLFADEQAEDYSPKEVPEETAALAEEAVDDSAAQEVPSEGSVADGLRDLESRLYRQRSSEIEKGVLRIRSEDEMLGVLVTLTKLAKSEYHAVDYMQVSEWFLSRKLNRYLTVQLDRVEKGVKLSRIRLVRKEELQYESREREHLEALMELHEQAGARLLLCQEEAIARLELKFAPHVGLFLIDRATSPVGVTGKLAGDGSIGRARVYIGEIEDLPRLRKEYEELEAEALRQDGSVRAELRSLR